MSERNYYVICDDNCRFEGMTKEQILTAITQAVEQGEIHDVDTGFVTTIKEQNAQKPLKFWVGTQAQYNAISAPEENTLYLITDPQIDDELQEQIDELREDVSAIPQLGALLWEGEAEQGDEISVSSANKYNAFIINYSENDSDILRSCVAIRSMGTPYIEGFAGYLLYSPSLTPCQMYCRFIEDTDTQWTVNYLCKYSNNTPSFFVTLKAIYGLV